MAKFKITHSDVNQMYDDAMAIVESRRALQSGPLGAPQGQLGQHGTPQGSLVEQIRQMAQAKLGRPQP